MRVRLSPCFVMFFAPHLFGAPWTDHRVNLQRVVGINCNAAQTSTSITKCAPTTAPLSWFPQYTLSSSDCLRELSRVRGAGAALSPCFVHQLYHHSLTCARPWKRSAGLKMFRCGPDGAILVSSPTHAVSATSCP